MTVAIAAQKPIHQTHRVEFDGAVDADGHILEPHAPEVFVHPLRSRNPRMVSG